MASPTPVQDLLEQHPENPIRDTLYSSNSNKPWAKNYPPIKNLHVHTYVNEDGGVGATYHEAFLDMYEDDDLRLQELAYPPNYRAWRLAYEEDGINWFHSEISNVVLAAWARYPAVLQASHEKPLTESRVTESVDIAYSVKRGTDRVHLAIGEFKRCLVSKVGWQAGKLNQSQQGLSQELRGYACLYRCPQVFCFDNRTFLMLQFRAATLDGIRDPECTVDCWVFPRDNPNGVSLRSALYRLLAQGFRRCQAQWALWPTLYGIAPDRREFYNGRPLWKIDGRLKGKPWGHRRRIDTTYGAFYWTDTNGEDPLIDDGTGEKVWDTMNFWEPEQENMGQDSPGAEVAFDEEAGPSVQHAI